MYYFGDPYSSTRRFNCHGYAWNMVEGGPIRWIGYYPYNTDEHIYWEDGSYIEVCNEMYPGKVSWASGDHTAITTPTPGRWISKWNEWPLMEHDWNDTPFGTSNLKYYVPTSIAGSTSGLCSGTRTFSVANISGATYTWSVNGSVLSIVSGQGTHQLTVQRNGSNSGLGWVEVEISTPCSSLPATSKRVQFDVGFPVIDCIAFFNTFEPDNMLCPPDGGVGYLCTTHTGNGIEIKTNSLHYQYEIQIRSYPSLTVLYTQTTTTTRVQLVYTPTMPGWYNIRVRAINNTNCGPGPWYEDDIEYKDCNNPFGGEEGWKVYPNPASATLTVSIGNEAERAAVPDKSLLPAFRVLLYDGQGRQVRQGEGKDGAVQFDTRQLPNGTYFLHIHSAGGQVEKRQVVIRH